MSAIEMPFNELMSEYYNRSNESRNVRFVHDIRNDEQELPVDIFELQELSHQSLNAGLAVNLPENNFAEPEVVQTVAERSIDAPVKPKSFSMPSSTELFIILGLFIVALLLFSYLNRY